jgi:hypothetical protein
MEPLSTVTSVLSLAKSAGEISKKLDELWKSAKDRETKHQIELVVDQLHDLKRAAVALEDENRQLKEKLRFKSDDYEFLNPFWYVRGNRMQPLCAKCFAEQIAAPMGEPGQGCTDTHRKCLVCGNFVEVEKRRHVSAPRMSSGGSPWG